MSDELLSWGISGMDSCEFLQGRPFGDCDILYRKSFANGVTRINCSSKRFCALSINLPNIPNNSKFSLLLVCLYAYWLQFTWGHCCISCDPLSPGWFYSEEQQW